MRNVYFQEGNFETESVNMLTDMQDPSVESSSVTYNKHHEIINSLHHLIDEDEDDISS